MFFGSVGSFSFGFAIRWSGDRCHDDLGMEKAPNTDSKPNHISYLSEILVSGFDWNVMVFDHGIIDHWVIE